MSVFCALLFYGNTASTYLIENQNNMVYNECPGFFFIDLISQLLSEEDTGRVITLLTDQSEFALKEEIWQRVPPQ